jgi:hypothetical protein
MRHDQDDHSRRDIFNVNWRNQTMKLLLIVLALLSSSVSAQEIFATSDNNSGGKIVLLSTSGGCPKGQLSMFAASSAGESWHGCWTMLGKGKYMSIKYSDGAKYMYDGDRFELAEYYRKKF